MGKVDKKFEEYADYLSGEGSLSENENLLERLKNDPEEKKVFELLESIWLSKSPKMNLIDRVWDLTSLKIGFNHHIQKTHKLNFIIRYAAIIVILVSIGLNAYLMVKKANLNPINFVECSTNTGEVKKLTLPDGSNVWLNSQSTIIFPEKFDRKKRNVFLIGEAFFKVEKNPEKPFFVNTSAMVVKVLGTSFNISNYNNDPTLSTILVEGKVELINKVAKGKNIVMSPNEEVLLNKTNGEISIDKKPEPLVAPWREGRFRFYKTDLLSIAHQLERKYDCQIVIVDKAAETMKFTADFEDEGLDKILGLLNKAHSFNLKKKENKYFISLKK